MKWRTLVLVVLAVIAASVAFADPNGPTSLNVLSNQRGAVENTTAKTVNAQAGNISELVINATAITKNWQGYFGNVSGKITLDDANNWTMYDWNYANPQGRVFAARIGSVNWATIDCVRYNANGTSVPNVTTEELFIGAGTTDVDGVDETFGIADHPAFAVGNVNIASNRCNSTFLYVNDSAQSSVFREVLLTDNSSNASVIYTALIDQNIFGFNNKTMDFEMLVGENGHGNSATTAYNFWVELQ